MPAAKKTKETDLRTLTVQVQAQEAVLREGGGASGRARQERLGRLVARDRIEALLDKDSPWLEVGLWAGYEMYEEWGKVPAAGVLTGIGVVSGRRCMIVANDATVKAGAFFPQTVKKVLRAQRIAFENGLPLLYLVDSSGVFLPLQDEIFPDDDDFGAIFRNNAVFSAAGLPQIAAIMGACIAGGAYLPMLCDKILMTEGSSLYLAGPALVKAAIGQDLSEEELGGATMHATISGSIDFHEKDDPACLKRLRSLVKRLPEDPPAVMAEETSTAPAKKATKTASGKKKQSVGPSKDPEALYDLVDVAGHKLYDVHDLLACVVDAGSVDEYRPDFGQTIVCAYADIGGRPVGIVANQRVQVTPAKGAVQMGGVIYADSADKAARFIMDCGQTKLPLIFFQDVRGFMVGRDAEQSGIIRSGAKLVSAVSNTESPKITVITNGSFGAGNYAMCGKGFDPRMIFAWPNAQYAVMGGAQAAKVILQIESRQAKRRGEELDEKAQNELREKIEAAYEHKTDIRYGAARGWVDAIIAPHTTRDVLIQALATVTRPAPQGGFRAGVLQT
ncbi:MAG: acyl-CoA carboxylase subunit beta [Planctomycetota bacterium]